MRKDIFIIRYFAAAFVALALLAVMGCGGGEPKPIRSGDIIFQDTNSVPSAAIDSATNAKYNNMGLVYDRNGEMQVYEVTRTVRMMPLEEWIAKGRKGKYRVKRLADADETLTDETLEKIYLVGLEYLGKPCDLTFEWSDDRFYCSELVWKIYHRALGIEIGQRQHMKDLDLSGRVISLQMQERFKGNPPLEEWVISPQAIYDSPLLVKVR